MAEEHIEFAAKDVFVLLGVPVPEDVIAGRKLDEQYNTDDVENESQFSLDEDDKLKINAVTEPLEYDLTPAEKLDYSSSDSQTKSELEDYRWYDPTLKTGLDRTDFNSLKNLLTIIRHTDPSKTAMALAKLESEKILEEPYQNMFISLNGLEVLINILECNNEICLHRSLIILNKMSPSYGIRCELCQLDAVKPLLSILVFNHNTNIQCMAACTLHDISKMRRGRKLIRLSGGIRVLLTSIRVSKSILNTSMKHLNEIKQLVVKLAIRCVSILNLLCRSLKSQAKLWEIGFIQLVPQFLKCIHSEIQISIMSLVAQCCRTRTAKDKQDKQMYLRSKYKLAVKEMNMLPQVIQLMLSDATELAAKATETILSMFDGDYNIHETMLKNDGLYVLFKAAKKFESEGLVMELLATVLWKCSMDLKCRQVIEKEGITDHLLDLLSYKFNDRVIGFAVAALSELWDCESLQPILRQKALPKYLELLHCLHSQILVHVCGALSRMSSDPYCEKVIDEGRGFEIILGLLPFLDIDEFNLYDDFYEADTIIAAANCLTVMINNRPDVNRLNRMYEALCELANLTTHKNLDVLAAVCQLIGVVAKFEENVKVMAYAGIVDNLAKLISTEHTNLRINLCKAFGRCCRGGITMRNLNCKNTVEQLLAYKNSENQIIRDSVPLALSGLSEDPLHCVKIEALGYLPFLKQCVNSDDFETRTAAVECLRNVRLAGEVIGQYRDCKAE